MKKENEKNRRQDIDPHLDVPAEANREKHHNFLADSEDANNDNNRKQTERQKQWKEGLEEGRAARDEN